MNSVINCTRYLDGRKRRSKIPFGVDERAIDLSNGRITRIDLRPLKRCMSLEKLDLHNNRLKAIDLSPLSSCKHLKAVNLESNQLQIIDVTPLARTTGLQELRLARNLSSASGLASLSPCIALSSLTLDLTGLKKTDLTPLTAFQNLQTLELYGGQDPTLDLSPLRACNSMLELSLECNSLRNIDLSPLATCNSLRTLKISINSLKSIDLSPLTTCRDLRTLDLHSNLIEQIDLGPLTICSDLRVLNICHNRLHAIELSPLDSCRNLEELRLADNEFSSVELTPLSSCTRLTTVTLPSDNHARIDPTPLSFCASLDWRDPYRLARWLETLLNREHLTKILPEGTDFGSWDKWHFDSPVPLHSTAAISFYLRLVNSQESAWKALHLLHGALQLLGLGWVGMLDIEPLPLLMRIVQRNETSTGEIPVSEITSILCRRIDSGGTGIGLDIDRMIVYPELAARVSKILASRKEEMKHVFIGATTQGADLRALWLTAYGYAILTRMGLGTICKKKELEHLQQLMQETKLEVGVSEEPLLELPDSVSQPMREYIWALAEYKTR